MNNNVHRTYAGLANEIYEDGHKANLRIIADDLLVDHDKATQPVLSLEQQATQDQQGIATVQPVFPAYIGRAHNHTAITLNPSHLTTTYAAIHLGVDSDDETESGLEAQLTPTPNTAAGINSHVSRQKRSRKVSADQTARLLTKQGTADYLSLPHRTENERGTTSIIFDEATEHIHANTDYQPNIHVANQAAYTLRRAIDTADLQVNDTTTDKALVNDDNIDYTQR